MSVADILLIALVIVILSWSDLPLRLQGGLVALSAVISIYSFGMPIADAAMIYIGVDLIGAIAGLAIHHRWRGHNGLLFFWLAVAGLTVHLAMFMVMARHGLSGMQAGDLTWWYKFFLNIIFALTALSIGGRGFARTYRHCSLFVRHRAGGAALRNHGQ